MGFAVDTRQAKQLLFISLPRLMDLSQPAALQGPAWCWWLQEAPGQPQSHVVSGGTGSRALSVLGPAHFNTSCSPLFKAAASRGRCRGCETSARLCKAGVGLHQAVVAEVASVGDAELLFFCLSSFIFAPSCSPVLCARSSRLPRSSWAPAAIKSRALRFALPMAPSPGSWDHSLPSPSSPARSHHRPLAGGAGFWAPHGQAAWGEAASSWPRFETAAKRSVWCCRGAGGKPCPSLRGERGVEAA